jgi:DNA invertase Pin-like site-specific DNA recombinase
MKNKCAIYVRVSTSNGTQDYTRQINELSTIAIREGYKEDNLVIYSDSISGYKFDERDQLNKLLEIIRGNPSEYGCIYISEISRLGRRPRNTRNIIDELIDLNVPIYVQSLNQRTIDEYGKRNGFISISLQLMLEMADMEAQTFKIRSQSGRIQKVKEGKVGGGKYFPYGYKKGEEKKLVVDDEESEVIKSIFNLYHEGFGVRAISHILNSQNIPTRSNKSFPDQEFNYNTPKKGNKVIWSDKQIHDILRNPIYKGKRRFLGELYDAPIIIDEHLFNKCNELLKSKNNRNSNTEYTYLLKDLITCGVCGRNYSGRYKVGSKGDKVYKCSSTLIRGGSCTNKGVNISLIETLFFELIINSSSAIKLISNVDELTNDIKKEIKVLKSMLINSENILNKNSNKLNNLLELLLDGDITKEKYRIRKEEEELKIFGIKVEISALEMKISEKTNSLYQIENPENTKLELLKKTTDRRQLNLIFKQIIGQVIINFYEKDFILITTKLKVGNEVLKVPLKIMVDNRSFRKKYKIIRYKSLFHMEFEPYFRNGILDTNQDILDEFLSYHLTSDWEEIQSERFLKMKIPSHIENKRD